MRQPGGTTGTATAATPAPLRTDYGDGSPTLTDLVGADDYGRGSPSLSDLLGSGAITPTPPITENARRMKEAAAGTLVESPLFIRPHELGPAEPDRTRVPGGISLWGGQELLTDVLFETVDAVVRDGQIRNVDLSDPDAATTVQMVLEDVIWRGRDVIRWRTLGCVEIDDEGPAWVRPAPTAAVALFLGLISESDCKERAGRTYRDHPDLAPPTVKQLEVDDEGRVSDFGQGRRTGALPAPDPALRSWEAHHVASYMLAHLTLGAMRRFAGYKPKRTLRTPGGPTFDLPMRLPLTGRPGMRFGLSRGAVVHRPGEPGRRADAADHAGHRRPPRRCRVLEVLGATIDGEWQIPAPPDWIASMLLIGPRAREAYALQRGRRELGPDRGGRERGNFPLDGLIPRPAAVVCGDMAATPAIEIGGLRKSYGSFEAVRGLSLRVAQGEIFAFLGPNGAGKTTTVEILEGFRRRTAGEVRVLGVDPEDGDRAWRARLGIVLQEGQAQPELTVRETLSLWSAYYPHPRPVDETIALAGLEDKAADRVGRLSGGQRRRLDVALALIGDPDLVFLDEPTTGFDPVARHAAWKVIAGLRDLGKTVFLTTHYLDEAQELADRVAIVKGGVIVAEGAPRDLAGREQETEIAFVAPAGVALSSLPGGAAATVGDDGRARLRTQMPTRVLAELCGWAAEQGIELERLEVTRPSLEDVYLELVEAPATVAP